MLLGFVHFTVVRRITPAGTCTSKAALRSVSSTGAGILPAMVSRWRLRRQEAAQAFRASLATAFKTAAASGGTSCCGSSDASLARASARSFPGQITVCRYPLQVGPHACVRHSMTSSSARSLPGVRQFVTGERQRHGWDLQPTPPLVAAANASSKKTFYNVFLLYA